MVEWTIEAAVQSGRFCRVLVSTDDEEIARLARNAGAEVPFLRERCADDHSPASAATLEALVAAEQYWAHSFDTVTQLMASCPLRTAHDIIKCHAAFLRSPSSSLISCVPLVGSNAWWAATLGASGVPKPLHPDALVRRSQDLPALFVPTGAVWCSKASVLRAQGTYYSAGFRYHPIDWMSGVDIDTWDDLKFAEVCFRHRDMGALACDATNDGVGVNVNFGEWHRAKTQAGASGRVRTALLVTLHAQRPGVRHYFRRLEFLLEHDCPLEAGLAWVFSMQECVQRRALKLLRDRHGRLGGITSRESRKKVEGEELRRKAVLEELQLHLGDQTVPPMPQEAIQVRNDVIHGRRIGAARIQSACVKAIEWCAAIDELIRASIGQGPLDDMRRRPRSG
jgi:N-acylneuraminate cytidylyltransferase